MRRCACTFLIFFVLFCKYAYCYDDEKTHRSLTEKAADNPPLKQYLKSTLGFADGLSSRLDGNTILWWLKEGSYFEDHPPCRASNHFHNPLLTWDRSYLKDDLNILDASWLLTAIRAHCDTLGWPYTEFNRKSAITWATGMTSPDGAVTPRNHQDMGWDNARQYLYAALTSATPAARETNFAKTFQSVGQVMHLLQDMAVPAHVRNDFESHLTFRVQEFRSLWPYNPFEFYVKERPGLVSGLTTTIISLNTPTFPRTTDFWDTTQYRLNTDPNAILTGVGLAEYTSGTFFSDSTIPNNKPTPEHDFPNPKINVDSLHQYVCMDNVPGKAEPVKYVSRKPCLAARKAQDHFAAVTILHNANDQKEALS